MMDDTDLTDHHGEAEALRKENARLRAERDRWRNDCLDANNSEFQLRRRAEAAEADLATLRAQPDLQSIPFPKLRQRLHDAEAALAALRAQPDWKAMAERLGEALEKIRAMDRRTNCRHGDISKPFHLDGPIGKIARAALSDLAKMKEE